MLKNTPKLIKFKHFNIAVARYSSQAPITENQKNREESGRKNLSQLRHVYPEFLPDPNVAFRNAIREKLERQDMLARRSQIPLPEFYVGSILAVTTSDIHSPGKTERFVGICIKREGCGLRSKFILRNVIDHEGVEILYELYDPAIQKMEVLRLEKRLDDELLYLRDSLPEYSTFDVNMEPELIQEGAEVPINPLKVKLKPRPWQQRWERKNLQGVQPFELPQKVRDQAKAHETPWEKYDLMKTYMKTIPEEEQNEIFGEIINELQKYEISGKKMKRKRTFVKPVKLA